MNTSSGRCPESASIVQVRFSPPPIADSPLARIDARWRLAGLLLAMLAAACIRTLAASTAGLAGAVVLAHVAHLPWRWFGQRLLVVALTLAIFVLPLPLLAEQWSEGARLAGVFAVKAVTLSILAAVLVVAAPPDATLKAAHALHVPGLFIHLALLSHRYLFVLGDELARLRVALRVRGFRNRASAHSYRTVGQAAGTLLVHGYERAEGVSQAMRCRGFDGRFRSLAIFRTRRIDIFSTTLMAAVAVAVVGLDVFLCYQ
jgi:cobalt/nickel transport system permease protein